MTAAPAAVYVGGRRLPLGPPIGQAEGATIFAAAGHAGLAVAIEREPRTGREQLVRTMVRRPPTDPRAGSGPPTLAWPDEVAVDETGQFVGFVAPRVEGAGPFPLGHAGAIRALPWRDRCALAADVASATAAVHAGGWALGRLAPEDLRVTAPAMVTIVGWGSVTAHGGRTGIIADDCRELAVLVVRLLIGPEGAAEAVLPPSVRQLWEVASGASTAGAHSPPTAVQWRNALAQASHWVALCSDRPEHTYPAHLAGCPWCEPAAPRPTTADRALAEPPVGPESSPARWPRRALATAAAAALAGAVLVAVGAGGNGGAPPSLPTATTVAAAAPTSGMPAASVLFAEEFTSEARWMRGFGPTASRIADGRLHVALPARVGMELAVPVAEAPRGSVRIEADVEAAGGARFAFVCRRRVMAYEYRAELDQRGWWLVVDMVNEPDVVNTPLRQASNSDQFARSVRRSGPNRVALECAGDDEPGRPLTMRLYVNDELVTEVTIPSGLGPGRVAIAAQGGDAPGEVWFDNLVVTQL